MFERVLWKYQIPLLTGHRAVTRDVYS